MSNAKVMLDYIRESCPDKVDKKWVIWALNYVIQSDVGGDKISPSFLRLPGQKMRFDPVMNHYANQPEDIEPEMK